MLRRKKVDDSGNIIFTNFTPVNCICIHLYWCITYKHDNLQLRWKSIVLGRRVTVPVNLPQQTCQVGVEISVNLPQQTRQPHRTNDGISMHIEVILDSYQNRRERQFNTSLPWRLKYMFNIRMDHRASKPRKHKQKLLPGLSGNTYLFDMV
jgi:hypothetical protein